MNSISIIIPTFKSPEYLDLCIQSIISGQTNSNETVVVVDGTYDINKNIIDKHKKSITPVIFDENYGLSKATNHGIYNAKNEIVLVVNDDNVFPKDWDTILLNDFNRYKDNVILTPNQVEPYPSMFRQFIQYDFGKNIQEFNLNTFQIEEPKFRRNTNNITDEGSTLPFMMYKTDYMCIGGWDEAYPSGNVVDWDFFAKCNLAGYSMKRSYNCNFYHFVSVSYKSPEQIENSKIKEKEGFDYFKYKWGTYPTHDPVTNLKSI
jgi:GT2 family glycosyltransferase